MGTEMTPIQATGTFEAHLRLAKKIYRDGAIIYCSLCGRTKEKTAEEMAAYLSRWPRCCKVPAQVKLKPAATQNAENENRDSTAT